MRHQSFATTVSWPSKLRENRIPSSGYKAIHIYDRTSGVYGAETTTGRDWTGLPRIFWSRRNFRSACESGRAPDNDSGFKRNGMARKEIQEIQIFQRRNIVFGSIQSTSAIEHRPHALRHREWIEADSLPPQKNRKNDAHEKYIFFRGNVRRHSRSNSIMKGEIVLKCLSRPCFYLASITIHRLRRFYHQFEFGFRFTRFHCQIDRNVNDSAALRWRRQFMAKTHATATNSMTSLSVWIHTVLAALML